MTVWSQQLQEWLNAKECEHLEFKEAKNNFHFEKLVKYCAALDNEGGGSMVLGVSDTRYELSPQYYSVTNRTQMLDRDAAKAVIVQFIESRRSEGCTLADMLAEFPSVSRDQLKAMLKELKSEGKAHSVGRTKGGRWYPGGVAQ